MALRMARLQAANNRVNTERPNLRGVLLAFPSEQPKGLPLGPLYKHIKPLPLGQEIHRSAEVKAEGRVREKHLGQIISRCRIDSGADAASAWRK